MPGFPITENNGWLFRPADSSVNPGGFIPWRHHITKTGTTSEGNFGYEQSGNQLTFTIEINYLDIGDALEAILGSNRWNPPLVPTGNQSWSRDLPVRHLDFPNFWASKIQSARPLAWRSKGPSNVVAGANTSYYAAWILVIQFQVPHYLMLDDADLDSLYPPIALTNTAGNAVTVRQEWQRFVEWTPQPAGTYLTRPTGSFKWAENSATGPVLRDPFPSQIGQFVGTVEMEFIWRRVPRLGLFSAGGTQLPTQLLSVLGTVNADLFLGFPIGTLLFKGARIVPVESPNFRDSLGVTPGPGEVIPSLLYDIYLQMSYFNPTPGAAMPITRGHNLHPFSGDNKWYLTTTDGTITGARLFTPVAFANIFFPNA